VAAIKSKLTPAAFSIVLGSTRVANHCPKSTPNKLVVTSAVPAPRKTTQGLWDSAVINIVVIWVLSPISAKKMVKKVEAKMPQTFRRPPLRWGEGWVTGGFPCASEGVDSWGGREETSTGFPNSLVFFRFLSFSQILAEISRVLPPASTNPVSFPLGVLVLQISGRVPLTKPPKLQGKFEYLMLPFKSSTIAGWVESFRVG